MNRIAKSGKHQNTWRKKKLQVLWNIGSRHHQTSGDGRNNKKNYLGQMRKSEISSKRSISGQFP